MFDKEDNDNAVIQELTASQPKILERYYDTCAVIDQYNRQVRYSLHREEDTNKDLR